MGYVFGDSECGVYGADGVLIGIRMCIAESSGTKRKFLAGVYVCTNRTQNGACLASGPANPNITTAFTIYNRTASLVTSHTNNMILSISDMSQPSLNLDIDLFAFPLAMD